MTVDRRRKTLSIRYMNLLQRLDKGERLLADGAMGTLLQARGLKPGECPEQWCLTRQDEMKAIHQAYLNAGCDILECNSFGGSRYKLQHYGLEADVFQINKAAAQLARSTAGPDRHVLGSVGPTGAFMEPYGDETEEDFRDAFATQLRGLEAGGADMVIVETMTALEEARVAVQAARAETGLIVVASFTYDPLPKGGYATMMGVTPEQAAESMLKAGAHLLASNCGLGADHMVEIIRALKAAAPGVPLMAMPNAGMPVVEDGQTVFKETPQIMAPKIRSLLYAGVSIVGGCCGTTPEHIAAMRDILDAFNGGSELK